MILKILKCKLNFKNSNIMNNQRNYLNLIQISNVYNKTEIDNKMPQTCLKLTEKSKQILSFISRIQNKWNSWRKSEEFQAR